VPFERRGELLDEHLAAWSVLWKEGPASFEGATYRFSDVYLEPKPFRPGGPPLWFGGSSLHDRLLRRLVMYGSGFNPLGSMEAGELERLANALAEAGRDIGELEMLGGTRGSFPGSSSVADLDQALASIPHQVARGFTTICIKPSQFIDDRSVVGAFCLDVVERVSALLGQG
jgi:alkanesulfonate monooxygenase SsuD/methylene tetrahydromethanopterin reductase-like flavin-dependent oxidoreductase (luciferase family)